MGDMTGDDIVLKVAEALALARSVKPSREVSLTITKLQEAMFWATEESSRFWAGETR